MTAVAHAFSLALLHFVWQGAIVAGVLWLALFALRRRSANVRYALTCGALGVLALLPPVTTYVLYHRPTHGAITDTALSSGQVLLASAAHAADWLSLLQAWTFPAWCAGVSLFSSRLVWGSRQISVMRSQGDPANGELRAVAAQVADRLGLMRPFEVMISRVADGPGVVGLLRPVLLLPAATLLSLTPEQLEAVLAHELAHIRRYDYLVNVAQMVVEALLFYHPAVWWTSARIRRERELCCDDEAVRVCGDSVGYARALAALERLRMTTPAMASGAVDGPLAYRIKRLLGAATEERLPSKLPAVLALCIALALTAVSINRARGQASPDAPGVKVDLGSSSVIHRTPVEYPATARDKGVSGAVSVEVRLDDKGNVSDARVLSGPDEFRKTVLQSVLNWHFPPEAAGSTKVVNVQFQTSADSRMKAVAVLRNPGDPAVRPETEATTQFLEDQVRQMQAKLDQVRIQQSNDPDEVTLRDALIKVGEREIRAVKAKIALAQAAQALQSSQPIAQAAQGKVIRKITLVGIDIPLTDFLAQAQLPVREGDILTQSSADATIAAVRKFDEHLTVLANVVDPNGVELTISPLAARAERRERTITEEGIREYVAKVAAAQPAGTGAYVFEGLGGAPQTPRTGALAQGTFGPLPKAFEGRIVRAIHVNGLGVSLDDFLAQTQLPLREGDRFTPSSAEATVAAVKKFDEHLNVFWISRNGDPDGIDISIAVADGSFVDLGAGGRGGGVGGGVGAGVGGGRGRGAGGGLFPEAANAGDPAVSPPVPIYQPAPGYTDEAKNAKWQGTVLLSILVDETGKVVEEKVVRALGMGLDQKAMQAVWQWRFKPGTKNGQPVAVRANIEVNFRLP